MIRLYLVPGLAPSVWASLPRLLILVGYDGAKDAMANACHALCFISLQVKFIIVFYLVLVKNSVNLIVFFSLFVSMCVVYDRFNLLSTTFFKLVTQNTQLTLFTYHKFYPLNKKYEFLFFQSRTDY
jgi:hypothetical protein